MLCSLASSAAGAALAKQRGKDGVFVKMAADTPK